MKKSFIGCCGLLCLGLLLLYPVASYAVVLDGADPEIGDLGFRIIEGEGDIPPAISIIRYSEVGSSPGVIGVPEPSTFLLAASAAAGILALGNRRRR